jgi:hypothetical protein
MENPAERSADIRKVAPGESPAVFKGDGTEAGMTNQEADNIIGVDVCKATLDIHEWATGRGGPRSRSSSLSSGSISSGALPARGRTADGTDFHPEQHRRACLVTWILFSVQSGDELAGVEGQTGSGPDGISAVTVLYFIDDFPQEQVAEAGLYLHADRIVPAVRGDLFAHSSHTAVLTHPQTLIRKHPADGHLPESGVLLYQADNHQRQRAFALRECRPQASISRSAAARRCAPSSLRRVVTLAAAG